MDKQISTSDQKIFLKTIRDNIFRELAGVSNVNVKRKEEDKRKSVTYFNFNMTHQNRSFFVRVFRKNYSETERGFFNWKKVILLVKLELSPFFDIYASDKNWRKIFPKLKQSKEYNGWWGTIHGIACNEEIAISIKNKDNKAYVASCVASTSEAFINRIKSLLERIDKIEEEINA